MKTTIRQVIRKYRTQPNALLSALLTITPDGLIRGIVELITARELRLHSRKRKPSLCDRFDRYDKENPGVGEWLLSAAQEMKEEQQRERYGMGALLEKMRWDAPLGITETESRRISNDFQSCYVRQALMRDPSLCGLFKVSRTSDADALVVDGRPWIDFAKEHAAELWPEPTPKRKNGPTNPAQSELALRRTV